MTVASRQQRRSDSAIARRQHDSPLCLLGAQPGLVRVLTVAMLSMALPSGCSDNGTADADATVPSDVVTQLDVGDRATASGTLETFGLTGIAPLPGATITELDAAFTNSVTSAADGTFSIAIPREQPIMLEFTADGHLPLRLAVVAPASGLSELVVRMLAPSVMNVMLVALNLDTQDPTKGLVIVDFDGDSKKGGEKATLSLAHAEVITLDFDNLPVKSDTLIPQGSGILAFPNVDPGSTTVTLEATTGSCALAYPAITTFDVLANGLTLVQALCTQP